MTKLMHIIFRYCIPMILESHCTLFHILSYFSTDLWCSAIFRVLTHDSILEFYALSSIIIWSLQLLEEFVRQTFDLFIMLLVSESTMIFVFFASIQVCLHVEQFIKVSIFIEICSHFCFCKLFMKYQDVNILVILVVSSGHEAEELWLNHIFITLYNLNLFSKDLV